MDQINELEHDVDIKEAKTGISTTLEYFGAYSLRVLDKHRQEISQGKSDNFEKMYLSFLRQDWQELFEGNQDVMVVELFRTGMEDCKTKDLLKKFLKSKNIIVPENFDAASAAQIFEQNTGLIKEFPDNLLENFTRTHIKGCGELQKNFERKVWLRLLKKIDKKMKQAIKEGVLPISIERWEQARDRTLVTLIDPIYDSNPSYHYRTGIKISPSSSSSLTPILIHEFLHAVSGEKARPRWLDEAITEHLTLKVCKMKNGEYVDERNLLKLLCESIGYNSEDLFVRDHFEEQGPSEKDLSKLPYREALRKRIDERLGPFFLANLDRYINQQHDFEGGKIRWQDGVEKALNQWKKFGKDFSSFLEEWVKEYEVKFVSVAEDILSQLKPQVLTQDHPLREAGFSEAYEIMWRTEIKKLVPYRSKYELTVIKDLVKECLEKIIFDLK